jgi:hypothetical protein
VFCFQSIPTSELEIRRAQSSFKNRENFIMCTVIARMKLTVARVYDSSSIVMAAYHKMPAASKVSQHIKSENTGALSHSCGDFDPLLFELLISQSNRDLLQIRTCKYPTKKI